MPQANDGARVNLDDYPEVLTVDEAAEVMRTTRGAVSKMAKLGQIPSLKIGGRIRIPREALRKTLTGCTVQTDTTRTLTTATLLRAIRNKAMKQEDIVKMCVRSVEQLNQPDWKEVQQAIAGRWSPSAVHVVNYRIRKMLKNQRTK